MAHEFLHDEESSGYSEVGQKAAHESGPSSAILDQVDEYLNSQRREERSGGRGGEMGEDKETSGWMVEAQEYVSHDIDMDFDHLSHALLEHGQGHASHGHASHGHGQVHGEPRDNSGSFLDQDSLSPIALSGASPTSSRFQLDFSLIDEDHQGPGQGQGPGPGHNHAHGHPDENGDASREVSNVRPDMVFSPMVSPMVMPANSIHNTPFMGPSGPSYPGQNPGHGSTDSQSLHSNQNTPFMHATLSQQQQQQQRSKFSPLTSPALNAIEQQQQQQHFQLPDAGISNSRKGSVNNTRAKRTPHTTPLMGPTPQGPNPAGSNSTTNKIVKHSPHISSRRSITKFKGGSWDDMMFKLPDSSLKNENANNTTSSNNNSSYTPNSTHSSSNGSNPASDRLTPSSLMNYPKVILPSNSNNVSVSNDESSVLRATESPVIKPRRPSEYPQHQAQSQYRSNSGGLRQGSADDHLKSSTSAAKETNRTAIGHSVTSSTTTLDGSDLKRNAAAESRSSSVDPTKQGTRSQVGNATAAGPEPSGDVDSNDKNKRDKGKSRTGSDKQKFDTNTNGNISLAKETNKIKSLPRRRSSVREAAARAAMKQRSSSEDNENIDYNDENDDEVVKKQKQVHKVAEQGRRNRLNNALKDLDSLIPKELKDSAAIPSKATTVELAAKYIRMLLKSDR